MLNKGDYIKIISENPIPCMWLQLEEDKYEKSYYINILGLNEKLKNISKNKLKEDVTYKIDNKKYNKLLNIIENLKNNKNTTIIEQSQFDEFCYKMEINNISEDKYIIWYIEKIDLDTNIRLAIDTVRESGSSNSDISDTKMLELISDTIPDSVFFKDTKGIFRHCNKVFAENRNLTKEDVIGKTEKDINTPNKKIKKYKLEEEEIIKSKKPSISNSTLVCKDGSIKHLETIKVPLLDEHQTVAGVLGIARDISHRKEAEEEFERLRMEFFANLSHEFKTPLNLIFSSIQLIEFMIDRDKDNEKYKIYTNIIKQNGYRLLKMVNNLIDSTRLSSGCLEYTPQNYNIVQFIENICDSVQSYAKEENIILIFDTELEEKIMAFDLEKMERIMLNLLSNAIKYNRNRGIIEVKLSFEEKYLYIKVKDSGIGIPREKLDDVFKLFKQVNNRITKLSEGSGIGLSIVKSLVGLHNGTIKVDSIEGIGSEFLIKIPISLCKEEKSEKVPIKYNQYVETIDIEFSDIYSTIK